MAKGSDYRIKKIEKGPLQRFKNQNLIIKKFGEAGLQVYKAITGKRTTKELRQDLEMEQKNFDQIVNYMAEAGMIELEPAGAAEEEPKKGARKLEEIPPEEELEPEEEVPPLEEEPAEEPEEIEEEPEEVPKKPKKRKKPPKEEELVFEEITPIDFEEGEEEPPPEEEEPPPEEEEPPPEEEEEYEEEEGPPPEEEEEYEEEEGPPPEEEEEYEEIEPIGAEEEAEEEVELEPEEGEEELSPVEKIISDKYGDVGLQVYALIDGQRTAEEIMEETGLTEPKLVEILDFMDAQGIIKLDYPKGGAAVEEPSPFAAVSAPAEEEEEAVPKKEAGFVPMIEGESAVDEARGVSSPIETPIKAPVDIVKSVQLKAKLMLKFKQNKGSRVFELVDGKNDLLDISLKLDLPLYETDEILQFMLQNGLIILKPMSRTDVRKKYGDDGYAVYKRFGKEGLMLYELIGKELTIRQMADKITKDRLQIIDMFIFIHKVLGIELPIDRDVLTKQLGL